MPALERQAAPEGAGLARQASVDPLQLTSRSARVTERVSSEACFR